MEPVVPVHVSLWSDDDAPLEGRLLELDPERMKASFPVEREACWYALGRSVRLQLAPQGSGRKAISKAWVQGWYLERSTQVYELRFCDEAQVQIEVMPALGPAFNRRAAYRARTTPQRTLEALLRGTPQATPVAAALLDLSVRGASVALDSEEDLGGDGLHVTVALRVPDEPALELAGTVVHRQLHGSQVCYGLRFEELEAAAGDPRAERLARLVRALEVDELRRRAG